MIKTCIYNCIYIYIIPLSPKICWTYATHATQCKFCFLRKMCQTWHLAATIRVPHFVKNSAQFDIAIPMILRHWDKKLKKHWRNQILSTNLNIFDLDLAQDWENSLDNPWTHNRLWHRATVHFLRLQSLPLGRNGCYTPAWIYGNPKEDRRVTSGIIQLKSC